MASTCYSNTYYDEFQYYLKQFDEGKTLKNKVISNLFILHHLLEMELFEGANKRIQWHRENVKDGYFDEKLKFYELLSLHKQGLIKENIPSEDNFNAEHFSKELINIELKYKNNDLVGSYFNILKNLIGFLSRDTINFDSYYLLSETYRLLFKVYQYDISRATLNSLAKIDGPQGAYLNNRFEEFYQAVFTYAFYYNPEYVKHIDEEYEREKDLLPADAYRKYWYAKLVLGIKEQNSFYPIINKLKLDNINSEGYKKIPEYIFAIYEAWYDLVKLNKLNPGKLSKLVEARKILPELDHFRLIADAIYLRSLMLKGNIEDVIENMTLLRKKINKLVKFRKSVSTENYYGINVADFVVNLTLFRALEYLKQNNYENEEIFFDNLMGKHYQQSNNEVDIKFSLNKYDNKINRMGVYSKFRMLNDLSKEIIFKISDNPIPKVGKNLKKPYNSEFDTLGSGALGRIKKLNIWEKEMNLKNPERLTLDLRKLKKDLHENEVFFAFTHYGNHIAQYCTTRDYHYEYLDEVDTSNLFSVINNLKESVSNPNHPYKYGDAATLYKTYFSILDKCIKNEDQFVTILADPEIISIPINSLVVEDESGGQKWFFEKYNYTLLPSPNHFFAFSNMVKPKSGYLGLGDPILTKKTKKNLNLSLDNLLVTRGAVGYKSIKNFPSLPETYDEIIKTSTLFDRKKLLLKENATEKNLRSLILSDYEVIHFATHGITTKSSLNTTLPGLILTPVKDGPWFDDGYLSSNEIMQFSLAADLVILSACNTGIDKSQIYKFGFSELTQAFLIAGAKNVLATQWSIPSKETQSLINKILFRYKTQKNLAISFNKGLKDFLKIRSNDLHPFYWASFLPIGRSAQNGKKETLSIQNVFAKRDGFANDTFLNAVPYKENIYAAGLSVKGLDNWEPVLGEYNFVTDKYREINLGEYRTYRLGEVVDGNLVLLLHNNFLQNGISFYFAKYDLSTKKIEIIDKKTIKPNMDVTSYGFMGHSYSTVLKKHYFFTALSKVNTEDENPLVIYVYDKDYGFENKIVINIERVLSGSKRIGIKTFQKNGKMHFFVDSRKKDKTKNVCFGSASTETFIFDSENNYEKGPKYQKTVFFDKDPISGLIPVIKTKVINDYLPCFDYYFDIFNPKTSKFKNINHKFPLPTSSLYMAYINNKYVVVLSNQVFYGVDFDALGKNKNRKRYDDNFLLRYDYDRYANYQTNILIFNDKFKLENNISYPSRFATSIESVIRTDEHTIYIVGSRENQMSIERFTGF